jgi:hypothetical protein
MLKAASQGGFPRRLCASPASAYLWGPRRLTTPQATDAFPSPKLDP